LAPTKAAFTRRSGTKIGIDHKVNGIGISVEWIMLGGIDSRVKPVIQMVMQHLHLPLFLIAHSDVPVNEAARGALEDGAVGFLMGEGKT
jgi:hypothetical protein